MKITYRYCIICKEITKFELNTTLAHSECMTCNSRFALKKRSEVETEVLKEYNKKIKEVSNWLRKQQNLYNKIYIQERVR